MQQYPLITIVGGAGFIGRYIVKQLARQGFRLRILSRDAVAAEFLKTAGSVGQIVTQYADITRPETLAGKFAGSWAVINLVSALHESGRQTFEALNVRGARAVAEQARAVGAERLIHISALGIEQMGDTRYGRTKKDGEDAVRDFFPTATILRPSLVIGAEDRFFQRFARMSLFLPALPLIGGGKTRFQPTLAHDVASAVSACLADPATAGRTYALGGPEIMDFKTMLERMRAITNRQVCLINLPPALAKLMGRACSLLPFPPLITADQVKLLAHDNVVPAGSPDYAALNIVPGSVTAALPTLLARYVKV